MDSIALLVTLAAITGCMVALFSKKLAHMVLVAGPSFLLLALGSFMYGSPPAYTGVLVVFGGVVLVGGGIYFLRRRPKHTKE